MDFFKKVVELSSLAEPYAGGKSSFDEQIKACLPFLNLIPQRKSRVLVVGSGEGYEVRWLKEQGFSAIGITNSQEEIKGAHEKYQISLKKADMHRLPFKNESYDCLYASNILEHSVAPFIALREWHRVLKKKGWLILVMPSKEWLRQYYHFSVLTHSQTKELLYKAGFKLLAGPEMKSKIRLKKGDIFYDLGRGWGHYDGYVAEKSDLPKEKFTLGKIKNEEKARNNFMVKLFKKILKNPYNVVRVFISRHHHD